MKVKVIDSEFVPEWVNHEGLPDDLEALREIAFQLYLLRAENKGFALR